MDDNEKLTQLESRLTSRPNSPLFARLAAELLERGEVNRAVSLCENGMGEYPDYTTGYMIAARSYYAAGQSAEAERALRYILKHHTRHTGALRFLEEIKTAKGTGVLTQAGHMQAFETFAEQTRNELAGTEGMADLDVFLTGDQSPRDPIEELAASLEDAKIAPPPFDLSPFDDQPEFDTSVLPDASIATVTLATIYERQGQYAEAIATYHQLIEQSPADRARFMSKIGELQKLLDARGFGV